MDRKINMQVIDGCIILAMKDRNSIRLETLKMIKSEYVKKLKENGASELNEIDAIKLIQKMVNQHKDSIEQFTKAGRTDLIEKETKELEILKEFLPEEPSEDEIKNVINNTIINLKEKQGSISMKDMRIIISEVQPKFPSVQVGKIISECIKQYI